MERIQLLCAKICYILGVTKTHRRNEQMKGMYPEEYGLTGRELRRPQW